MTTKEKAARIRKALKAHPALKKISVRIAPGGWGWLDVQGTAEFGGFTSDEIQGFRDLGLDTVNAGGFGIAPDGEDARYTARYVLELLAA